MKPEYSDRRAPRKEIFGWAMFDFANSAFTTVIITVVFAEIFPRLIVGPDTAPTGTQTEYRNGNFLWSLAQVIGYALVVLTAPIFGAIMDYSRSKKKFLFVSYLITVIATASLFFVEPGNYVLGIILIATALFGCTRLPAPNAQELSGPPRFLSLLYLHATLSDPDRPSRILPLSIPSY